MPQWKTVEHLEGHFTAHRREFPRLSIALYDASAQETFAVGVRFSFRDRRTGLPRVGYFHRESSRMTVVDGDGFIVSHFRTDEEYVTLLPRSTYCD